MNTPFYNEAIFFGGIGTVFDVVEYKHRKPSKSAHNCPRSMQLIIDSNSSLGTSYIDKRGRFLPLHSSSYLQHISGRWQQYLPSIRSGRKKFSMASELTILPNSDRRTGVHAGPNTGSCCPTSGRESSLCHSGIGVHAEPLLIFNKSIQVHTLLVRSFTYQPAGLGNHRQ